MMSKIGINSGLSIIEILLTVTIFSLGFAFIYRGFLLCLDLYSYYSDYLNLGILIEQKFWELKDNFRHFGEKGLFSALGNFSVNNKNFPYNINYNLIDKDSSLYKIDLDMSMKVDKRNLNFLRSAYIEHKE
ncbi:MAG: hypothetical protein NC900_04900 [Candidatus Omnitrophica bacterium]|nr:hypothetical protein [Candidatus Omnitrophota bacterium]